MNGQSTFPSLPDLDPPHQSLFSDVPRTSLFERSLDERDTINIFYLYRQGRTYNRNTKKVDVFSF